ncbi:Pentatricopeptide repeat [Dillenia turbinata]|uniref:Pentatricopeptide repeat n=1 Tax=Dillenia turbinata TaxID=194707 RepID=A0AAN8URK0_9MAGN
MLFSGVEPNYVTIASILPLCAGVANLQHGKEFHCYITKREWFEDYLLLWNALVDMYARSGKFVAAKRVFDLLTMKGECESGNGHAGLTLFDLMIRSHIMPDHVAMVADLSDCSHLGLVIEGERLFEKMHIDFGITPLLERFDCMVDLYGRLVY